MKVVLKACLSSIAILIIAFALFILSSYITNGFESVSYLYLKTNGTVVKKSIELKESGQIKIEVKTAGFSKSINEYSVKIIPNSEYDFEYSADGKNYKFGAIEELTEQFNITIQESNFTLECSSMKSLLSNYHGGAAVTFLNEMSQKTDYFTLVVERESGKYRYVTNMCYYSPVDDIKMSDDVII